MQGSPDAADGSLCQILLAGQHAAGDRRSAVPDPDGLPKTAGAEALQRHGTMTHKEKNDMDNEVICIYFSDEPYVDATITKEELLAALKKQRGETFL